MLFVLFFFSLLFCFLYKKIPFWIYFGLLSCLIVIRTIASLVVVANKDFSDKMMKLYENFGEDSNTPDV